MSLFGAGKGTEIAAEAEGRHRRSRRLTRWARRHWLFATLFATGTVLRVIVQYTYVPAIFFADSFTYLESAVDPEARSQRPLGYSTLLLRPLLMLHDLAVIPAVQHAFGLAMGVIIYTTLLRHRVRTWLAALAAAPVLLDAYMLQIEENIASDSFFLLLVVTALALLTRNQRPSATAAATAGLLIGTSATVRTVALPLLVVLFCYLLLVGRSLRRRIVHTGLAVVLGAVPLLVYSAWTYTQIGVFRPGGDSKTGRVLQARVAGIADCRELWLQGAPHYILGLCPDAPPSQRPYHPRNYMKDSLFWKPHLDLPPDVDLAEARKEFAIRVTLNQPFQVLGVILADFIEGFAPYRTRQPGGWPLRTWWFHSEVRTSQFFNRYETVERFGGAGPEVHASTAHFLRAYQRVVYARGVVFSAGVLLPLAALCLRRARRTGLHRHGLVISASCVLLLLVAASFSFSWRYQLPSIPLLPWSAAFALAALFPARLRERRGEEVRSKRSARRSRSWPEQVEYSHPYPIGSGPRAE